MRSAFMSLIMIWPINLRMYDCQAVREYNTFSKRFDEQKKQLRLDHEESECADC